MKLLLLRNQEKIDPVEIALTSVLPGRDIGDQKRVSNYYYLNELISKSNQDPSALGTNNRTKSQSVFQAPYNLIKNSHLYQVTVFESRRRGLD